MNVFGVHFIHPWCLILMVPSLLLVYALWRKQKTQHGWQAYCDLHLIPHVVKTNNKRASQAWVWYLSLFFISACIALSSPSWQRLQSPVYRKAIARVIVLDLSDSMLASDLSPSRLQRAKYKVLDMLRDIHEGQTGMVVFSSQPFVVSPLTDDSHTISSMVPTLNTTTVPVQGSNIGLALKKAGALLKQAGAKQGNIILVSDSTPDKNDDSISQALAKQHYQTFVLAVGTAQGGPIPKPGGGFMTDSTGAIIFAKLHVSALNKLATLGKGDYVSITDNDADVKQLLHNTMPDTMNESIKQTSHDKVLWESQGHWFVWLAILWLLLLSRRGWRERVLP